MSNPFESRQAIIKAIFQDPQDDPLAVEKRLLQLARNGIDNPDGLASMEIKQICVALVMHFHQLGIN